MADVAKVDAIVIGAGVIGLACARQLAWRGFKPLIIERNIDIGLETSSRNSEVIHAGLYYPPGSLKAALCVEGSHKLYAYCDARHIPYNRCGKLIVATTGSQLEKLEALHHQAMVNGVSDVAHLTAAEARLLEPEISCMSALLSPST